MAEKKQPSEQVKEPAAKQAQETKPAEKAPVIPKHAFYRG